MSEFYRYFKENMDSLNLPAPESLFGTLTAAITNATAILRTMDQLGRGITLGEVIGAGTGLEVLGAIAGISAAFYVGAVIGSIAVATGRSLAGGTSMSDVILTANRYNLNRPWLEASLHRWPGIYNRSATARSTYRFHTVTA